MIKLVQLNKTLIEKYYGNQLFWNFLYFYKNTVFITGSLFSKERITNSETEKLNSISNVHNCGLISKENTCKIS